MSLWSIVLAGGEGQRLKPLTERLYGDGRPKQFCALDGGSRTMLERTLERVGSISLPSRTLVSVCRHHEPWHAAVRTAAPVSFHVQPLCRGTGLAVLLACLEVEASEAGALVGIFPSDHYVADDGAFAKYVREAAEWVARNRSDIVLLGVEATHPATDYGWLLPRQSAPTWETPEPVRLFEKPVREVALRLASRGALWNTGVAVGSVATLLRLFEALAPRHWRALWQAVTAGGAAVEAALHHLEPLDLSHHILARASRHLRGLAMPDLGWSDWGTEERVRASLGSVSPEKVRA